MIIAFGRAGNERKKLAWAIATIIGTTAEYQYMPTCTYKIGECYTVTKAGDLEISDQADRKETERLLAELAFIIHHFRRNVKWFFPRSFKMRMPQGNAQKICVKL